MDSPATVPWYQRLLLGFAATLFTLLMVAAIVAAQSFYREPGLRWFSPGGGIQVPVFLLYAAGLVALGMYVILVVPLVLLWPVRSQLKHWYAFLGVALLLPIAVFSKPWAHPGSNPHDILNAAERISFTLVPVLFGGACYLLLLRHRQARLTSKSYEGLPE